VRSLRQRLLILLLGLWTTVWLAVALITLDRSGHEVAELLDAQLAQTAHVLHRFTLVGEPPLVEDAPQTLSPLGHPYENKIAFQLWRGTELISTFGGAPDAPLGEAPGFSDQEIGETRWRVFGRTTEDPDEILFVAQSYTIRQELIRFLTIYALQPILWSLPVTALMIWFAVSDGLRPLRRLARDIGSRSSEQLTPVDPRWVPVEVRPLTDALNELLEELKNALSAERRFAADASHELRTPLTVIRAHAQIAERSQDAEERDQALGQLIQGVDRATHLVSQLLTFARLEPDAAEIEHGAWPLCETVAQVVEDERAALQTKSIAVEQIVPERDPCVVLLDPSILEILVRNLVTNAIKYTPEGGSIRIEIQTRGRHVVLQVADTGPGIPDAEKERIFERFYRTPGQHLPGAGLGLSIVGRICQLYGADITLLDGDDGHGLCAEVHFPAVVPSFA
jgi:signal transduction histidine kinase